MIMIQSAKHQFELFKATCSDMAALADAVGQGSNQLSLADKADFILLMEAVVDKIDEMRPYMNRNLVPVKLDMAKDLISKGMDEVVMHGHKFTVAAKCHFSPPPKTKSPEEYAALIRWLAANGYGDTIEEETKVSIGGKGLSELCVARMEAGESLPPHVSEFNQITVKTRATKK